MTAAGLRSLFRHHRQTTGVAKANPHRFRHTFATDMIRAGISLPALMQLMDTRRSKQPWSTSASRRRECYQQYVRAVAPTGAARSAVPLMSRRRLPSIIQLAEVFFAAIESVTTSMSGSSKGRYRTTMEYFLRFLGKHHPRPNPPTTGRDPQHPGLVEMALLAETATG